MQAEDPQAEAGRRQALEEAESTLEAIRSGQVDAFVIAGSEVVLLERASAPYRTLVEHMQQGAVTLSADGLHVAALATMRSSTDTACSSSRTWRGKSAPSSRAA